LNTQPSEYIETLQSDAIPLTSQRTSLDNILDMAIEK